jgi:hypothetical protein
MIPAAVMAGAVVTRLMGLRHLAAWLVIGAGASYAAWTTVAATLR